MKSLKNLLLISVLLFGTLFTACKEEEKTTQEKMLGTWTVTTQENFGGQSVSITNLIVLNADGTFSRTTKNATTGEVYQAVSGTYVATDNSFTMTYVYENETNIDLVTVKSVSDTTMEISVNTDDSETMNLTLTKVS